MALEAELEAIEEQQWLVAGEEFRAKGRRPGEEKAGGMLERK